jgi:hypothetical protein
MSAGPDPRDVAELTRLFGLMRDFPSDEQRARYLLSSNWIRERGAEAARINGEQLAAIPTADASHGTGAYVARWRRWVPHRHTRPGPCRFCGCERRITGYDDDYGYACWGWRRPTASDEGGEPRG